MGKVLAKFTNGCAGAIARSLDDVVVALANKSNAALAFGVPVARSTGKDGVVPFDPTAHTAADFIGVTVRIPSKTPDTYGASDGSYAPHDLVDVLVRGHIVVKCVGSGIGLGDPVSIFKTTGGFGVGTGDNYIPLDNVRISAAPDSNYITEILLTTRNLV